MKALRKNGYAVIVIILFVIALAMFTLFIALFSSSTSVDGTTVGSVYIGDQKTEKGRTDKLLQKVGEWQKNAIYTISYQNVSLTIGDEPVIDEETQKPKKEIDEDGNEYIVYKHNGLDILDFNVKKTVSSIIADSANNAAYFDITDQKKEEFFQQLVSHFGTEITDDIVFDYDRLISEIKESASKMTTKADFDLASDYYTSSDWNNTEVKHIEIEGLDSGLVDKLVEKFDGVQIEILPQKDPNGKLGFSAIEFFQDPAFSELTSAQMSIIATGIAAVVRDTSLTVTVKNQGYVTDKYYAYENMTARINIKDGTDLRIINPETTSYFIKVSKGRDDIKKDTSLSFDLWGCKFIHKYSTTCTETIYNYSVIYDDRSTTFVYDPEDPTMGIDTEHENGCYYRTYRAGENTYLYSFTKTTTYVNGDEPTTVEAYPKQDFYVGKDELREWTRNGYKA